MKTNATCKISNAVELLIEHFAMIFLTSVSR